MICSPVFPPPTRNQDVLRLEQRVARETMIHSALAVYSKKKGFDSPAAYDDTQRPGLPPLLHKRPERLAPDMKDGLEDDIY